MTTHKVSELTGALLDAAVAKAEGIDNIAVWSHAQQREWRPSMSWDQGGPIIERERIGVLSCYPGWEAFNARNTSPRLKGAEGSYGDTCLIAAMRAFVSNKFGDTVELP